MLKTLTSTALALTLITQQLAATENCVADAMVVFDGSGSMAEMGFNLLDEPRIEEARRAMARAIPPISLQRRLGLIIYGPGDEEECNIDLRFGPTPDAGGQILRDINLLEPAGLTPLTASVRDAAETLNYRTDPGIVVLITDGRETCGGAPCALGDELAAASRDLTVHVIGFKVRADFFSWNSPEEDSYQEGTTVAKCLADRTGGNYFGTETVDELVTALGQTLGCTVIGRLNEPAGFAQPTASTAMRSAG